MAAIVRMNYIHSRWRQAGKIKDDDMLYTLELPRWVNLHDWRRLTDLELCACGTLWKSIGDAMQISYINLPSYRTGWRDGLHWLDEINEWGMRYEEAHMVPSRTNQQLCDALFSSILMDMSPQTQNMYKQIVAVLLGPRLRSTIM